MSVSLLVIVGVLFTVQLESEPRIKRTPDGVVFSNNLKEEYFVETIKRLALFSEPAELSPAEKQATTDVGRQDLLPHIEEFVKRFPNSPFREDALIIKLKTLADYAQVSDQFIVEFLTFTEEIVKQNPSGPLAEEHAYYSIQAFVLGARREQMPDNMRMQGVIERYQAFLEDFPKSQRRPVIWASLIRNLIATKKTDRAVDELEKLQRDFPDHMASRRAAGEVFRATGVGKPFAFQYTTQDARIVRTTDYAGKVLVVHFWADWSPESIKTLPGLSRLFEEQRGNGLAMIGINVDKSLTTFSDAVQKHKLNWPQYFDHKGFENEVLVSAGVIQLPSFLVIDRKGILRSTEPGTRLNELVIELLAESLEVQKLSPGAGG